MRSSDTQFCPYCNIRLHADTAAGAQPMEHGGPQKAVQLAASSSTYADTSEHNFMKHWDTYARHYAQLLQARKD